MPASSGRAAWRAGLLGVPVAALRALCRLARVPSRPSRGASGPLASSFAAGCVFGLPCGCALISHARRSPMSHVIPLHIFQTLKSDRWNCNVCGLSRKVTELNYVRNLAGGFLDDACRRVSTHAGASRRVSAPQLAAWTSGPSGAACASSWLDGRCVLPDLSPFYGIVSASDNPGPLVPRWG